MRSENSLQAPAAAGGEAARLLSVRNSSARVAAAAVGGRVMQCFGSQQPCSDVLPPGAPSHKV